MRGYPNRLNTIQDIYNVAELIRTGKMENKATKFVADLNAMLGTTYCDQMVKEVDANYTPSGTERVEVMDGKYFVFDNLPNENSIPNKIGISVDEINNIITEMESF